MKCDQEFYTLREELKAVFTNTNDYICIIQILYFSAQCNLPSILQLVECTSNKKVKPFNQCTYILLQKYQRAAKHKKTVANNVILYLLLITKVETAHKACKLLK